jgi:hypothetical protein
MYHGSKGCKKELGAYIFGERGKFLPKVRGATSED